MTMTNSYPASYLNSHDLTGVGQDRVSLFCREVQAIIEAYGLEGKASLTFPTTSVTMHTAVVDITNAELKKLKTTAKELAAAPGAGSLLVPVAATLILDYGSNVLTESEDNLIIGWNNGTTQAGEAIESGGFIDASADTITNWFFKKDNAVAAADVVNKNLALKNSGDSEFAGNAGNDTALRVILTYLRMASLSL